MRENIVTGKKYRILVDEIANLWDRISFWTKASDVEFDDGTTVEQNKATTDRKIANVENLIREGVPQNHADTTTKYGRGSSTQYGHVKTSDDYTSDADGANSGVAFTRYGAYHLFTWLRDNKAVKKHDYARPDLYTNDTPYGKAGVGVYGHVRLVDNIDDSSDSSAGAAATPEAVRSVYQLYLDIKRNQLTAAGKSFYFDYQNDKYGYNTSADGGAETFHPFNDPDSYSIAIGLHSCPTGSDYVTSKTFTLPKGTYRFVGVTHKTGSYVPGINFTGGGKTYNYYSTTDNTVDFHYNQFTLSSDSNCTLTITNAQTNLEIGLAIGYVYKV